MGYFRVLTGWSLACDLDDSSNQKPYTATVFFAGGYGHINPKKEMLKFTDEAQSRFATKEEAEQWIKETCDREVNENV